jgi:MYXO-CTERM domain-containing protein
VSALWPSKFRRTQHSVRRHIKQKAKSMKFLKPVLSTLAMLPLLTAGGPASAAIVGSASMSNFQFEMVNLKTGTSQFVELSTLVSNGGGWGAYNWGSGSTASVPEPVAEAWSGFGGEWDYDGAASVSNNASGPAFSARLRDSGLPPEPNFSYRSFQICASLTSGCSGGDWFGLDAHMALIISADASIQAQATESWESVEVGSAMGLWGRDGSTVAGDQLYSNVDVTASRRLQMRVDNNSDDALFGWLHLFTYVQSLSLPHAVPEPQSAALALLGLAGLWATRRRGNRPTA